MSMCNLSDVVVISAQSGANYFAGAICGELGIKLCKTKSKRFLNTNFFPYIPGDLRGKRAYVVQMLNGETDKRVIEAAFWANAAKHAGAEETTLIVAGFPYGRSDKMHQPGGAIGAEVIAGLFELECVNFSRIITCDLHNSGIKAYFKSAAVIEKTALPDLTKHLLGCNLGIEAVVGSDKSSRGKAAQVANALGGIGCGYCNKSRPDHSEKPVISEIIGVDVRGLCIALVDDEASSLGTILEGADYAFAVGATEVYAMCTHPVLVGGAAEKLAKSRITKLVVSNSIPVSPAKMAKAGGKLDIVPIHHLFSEEVY